MAEDDMYLFASTPGGVHIYTVTGLSGDALAAAVRRVQVAHRFPGDHDLVPDGDDWDLTMRAYIPTSMLKTTQDGGVVRQGPADHVTMHDGLPG